MTCLLIAGIGLLVFLGIAIWVRISDRDALL